MVFPVGFAPTTSQIRNLECTLLHLGNMAAEVGFAPTLFLLQREVDYYCRFRNGVPIRTCAEIPRLQGERISIYAFRTKWWAELEPPQHHTP
jgi:hypothetical protein